jgi:hypothetical protein
LPAGLDFTAHVPPVAVGVGVGVGDVTVGVGVGVVGGGVVGVGVGVVGWGVVGVGDGVTPSQAPRSFHREAAATGFQPAPAGGVWVVRDSYVCPL